MPTPRLLLAPVLVLGAVAAVASACGGGEADARGGGGPAAGSLRVLDRIPLPERPGGVAVGEGAVWTTDPLAGELLRLDPASEAVDDRFSVARAATSVAVGAGSVWVADPVASVIVRVDPSSGEVVARVPVGTPGDLVYGFDAVWVVQGGPGAVVRIDPRTNRVVARILLGAPASLSVGPTGVWVVDRSEGEVVRVDPDRNRVVARLEIGDFRGAAWVIAGGPAAWAAVSSPEQSGLARIDARTNDVLGLLPVSRERFGLLRAGAADARSVWIVAQVHVARIDPGTNRITGSVRASRFRRPAPADPRYADLGAAAVDGGSVWVAEPSTPAIVRVGTGA